MPKIPVGVDDLPTQFEALDEGQIYHVLLREVRLSEEPDKNGNAFLTNVQCEVVEPVEFKGRRVFDSYIQIPGRLTLDMDDGERHRNAQGGIRLARFVKCFKIPYRADGFNTEDGIGQEGDITVKNEIFNGRLIPKVNDYLI